MTSTAENRDPPRSRGRKLVAIDFDGVLHQYRSGWHGAALITDPPVPYAIERLREYEKRFDIAIFSSRNHQPGGIEAMRDWLNFHGLPREWILDRLNFPTTKPPAWVTIDDRALQFTGSFPSPDEIDSFKPWTQLVSPLSLQTAMPDHQRLAVEVSLFLCSRTCTSLEQRLGALSAAAGSTILTASKTKREVTELIDKFTYHFESAMSTLLANPSMTKHLED